MKKSGQDYLEAILVLELQHGTKKVRSTDIARHLNVSKPSVSRAMGVLKEGGYIEMESYGEVSLTGEGRQVAEEVYDRHRTLTRFIRDILGVDAALAEHDACLIEHDISNETMKALSAYVRDHAKGIG